MTPIQNFALGAGCRRVCARGLRHTTLVLSAVLVLAGSAEAATRHVGVGGTDTGDCTDPGNPCATIAYAIEQAGPGDTVAAAAGTYTEPDGLVIDKSLQLQGAGEVSTIVQAHEEPGEANGRVVTIHGKVDVEISDLSIRHGLATGVFPESVGGGFYVSDGVRLAVTNVTMRDNTADFGGGMVSTDSFLTLTAVTFAGNAAVETNSIGGSAGGLLTFNGSTALTDVTFAGNTADTEGGGMMSQNDTPTLVNVVFDDNEAGGFGGGMYTFGSSPTLDNVTFTGNNAPWGGGLYNIIGSPTLTNVHFIDNTAPFGGGMYNNGGSAALTGVTFSGNAALNGGGMINDNSFPTLVDVTFVGNTAGSNGGGMYNTGGGLPNLDGVLFTANSAASGGGMYVASGTPELSDATFGDNEATNGGGLYVAGGSVVLATVDFVSNTATGGGGGMVAVGGVTPVLTAVNFIGNVADNGGGMLNSGSAPELVQVGFTGNTAEQGGGMYNTGGSTPLVVDSTFTGNATVGTNILNGGGAVYNWNSSPEFVNVAFVDNVSVMSGGGMYSANGSAPHLSNVTFIGNVAAGNSGGGIASSVNSTLTVENGVFRSNRAELVGGGLWVTGGSDVTLVNVEVFANGANHGGGMNVRESTVGAVNLTFAGNSAAANGGGLRTEVGAVVAMLNTIYWDNEAGGGGHEMFIGGTGSVVELAYGLYGNGPNDIVVAGGGSFSPVGSLTSDPLFLDAEEGDLRLAEGSPAVNAGDPDTDPAIFPTDGAGSPIDLDGNPRLVGPAVDMGPYESEFEAPTQPKLVFEPSSLDFGEVGVGTTSLARTARLRNTGNAAATELSFDLAGAAFEAETADCGDSLAASAECEVAVTFTPQAAGELEEALAVDSAEGAMAVLNLAGTGVVVVLPPQIEVDPEQFAVSLPEGQSGAEKLFIFNLGEESLDWSIAATGGRTLGPVASARAVGCESAPGLIHHDDGTIELGFPSILGLMLVDHFTPNSYPAPLSVVCLAFMTEGATAIDFELVVLADDGPGGVPGTELGAMAFSAVDIPEFTPPPPPGYEPTWYSFDVSPLDLTIESGGAYIGVRWTQMEPSVYLPIDASPPNPPGHAGGYIWNGFDGVWEPLTSLLPDYRALFVRAVASACADPLEVEWLEVDPASGSTPASGGSEVEVLFDAGDLSPGDYEALLCISSNDPSTPLLAIPVTLNVSQAPIQPELELDPPALDFGGVEVGETSPALTATLHNSGTGVATDLKFSEPSGGFAVEAIDCDAVLAAGESCAVSLSFTPPVPGPAASTLEVSSAEGAAAALGLAGNGVSAEPLFTAAALRVDPAELASDGNEVLEPGESVEVAPVWRNDGSAMTSLSGTASSFTGPGDADYHVLHSAAEYGMVAPGESASCLDTGVCYELEVEAPLERPAIRWVATFDEELSDGTAYSWSLHIGDSFTDVPRSSPFYRSVEILLHHETTGGCAAGSVAAPSATRAGGSDPFAAPASSPIGQGAARRSRGIRSTLPGAAAYCPTAENTRGQMPVFVLRALEGAGYTPPACVPGDEVFADVPAASGLCPWIQELSARGVVAGCGEGVYCPNSPVNRQQMAIFLLRTLEGEDYTPSTCTGQFADVPCTSPFAPWVEELASRGVTGGCATEPARYCPTSPVNRQQMAVFVTQAFGLELYGP